MAGGGRARKAAGLAFGLALVAGLELALAAAGVSREFARERETISPILRRHPVLFWRLAPDLDLDYEGVRVRTGPRARRGERPLEPGRPVVLCLGDSVTFGWRVEEDQAYPARLQAILTERAGPAPAPLVVNAGVPGYSSHQCRIYLERLIEEITPAVVVLGCGINDRFTARRTDAEQAAAQGRPTARLAAVAGRSQIGMLLARVLGRGGRRDERPPPAAADLMQRVPAADFRANLAACAALARERGFRLVLVNEKTTTDERPYNEHQRVMAKAAAERGLALVDMAARFDDLAGMAGGGSPGSEAGSEPADPAPTAQARARPHRGGAGNVLLPLQTAAGYDRLFLDNYHPNPEGHRVLAEEVARVLLGQASPAVGP